MAAYYHTFSKMKAGAIKNIEEHQPCFESYSTTLLFWIKEKTIQMQKRDFSNTLEGIKLDIKKFKDYRTVEKPLKYKDKVEIEAAYFDIQIKLNSSGRLHMSHQRLRDHMILIKLGCSWRSRSTLLRRL